MAKKHNKAGKVPRNEIVSGMVMAQRYVQLKGGSIKHPEKYGVDPLEGRDDLQEIRLNRYRQSFPRDELIFESIVSEDAEILSSAICLFQNLTIELSEH